MRASQGFVVIVPLVILLLMVSAGAMLIVDSVTQQSRFSGQINQQQRILTQTAQQLEMAIAASPIALRQSLPPTTIGQQTNLVHTFSTLINSAPVDHFELLTTDSTNSQIKLRQQLIRFPLLQAVPEAALMLSQPLPGSVGFTVYFSEPIPADAPLTVWGRHHLIPGPERHRCVSSFFAETICRPVLANAEAEAGSVSNSPAYPAPLLPALFGATVTSLSRLSDFARDTSDCNTLNAATRGLIIVAGPCLIKAGQQIGSPTAPVLIIATGTQLHQARYSQLNGLVIMLPNDTFPPVDIRIHSEARINGALIVEGTLSAASIFTVQYNASVLRNLQTLPQLQRVQPVIGSWRDF